MAVFLISYDLLKPDYNYDPLYEALAQVKAIHLQDSVWAIDTPSTSEVVFDYFWQHMYHEKDRLLVVPFDNKSGYKSQNAITLLKDL
jgi:hypothetical protein